MAWSGVGSEMRFNLEEALGSNETAFLLFSLSFCSTWIFVQFETLVRCKIDPVCLSNTHGEAHHRVMVGRSIVSFLFKTRLSSEYHPDMIDPQAT